jgi:hypothetical protein
MATNPPKGDGHRNGAVHRRSQVFNPANKRWTKRDSETGKFMDQKADGTPFKGSVKKSERLISALLCCYKASPENHGKAGSTRYAKPVLKTISMFTLVW